jgi:hypothetical protein
MAPQVTGFFKKIEKDYPGELRDLKFYAKSKKKLANAIARKEFLLKCRKNHIFPAHIIQNIKGLFELINGNTPYVKLIHNAQFGVKRKILNLEIKNTFYLIKSLFTKRDAIMDKILNRIPRHVCGKFFATQSKSLENLTNVARRNVQGKFDRLISEQLASYQGNMDEDSSKNVINLTGTQIPKEIEKFLGLGPKFSVTNKSSEIPYFKIIADSEAIINSLENSALREEFRFKISNIITNHSYKQKNVTSNAETIHLQNVYDETKDYIRTMKKDGNELMIINSDKGNKTVVMLKSQYDRLVSELLEDTTTYEKMDYDPTRQIEKRINDAIEDIHKRGRIDDTTRKKLIINNSQPPLLYVLPKVHKIPNGASLEEINRSLKGRPVVSSIGSATYDLSKYISSILNASYDSKYNVKNSFELVEKLKHVTIPDDFMMVSFDVVSLFTSVPVQLILESVKKRWEDISKNTTIDKQSFLKILTLVLRTGYFKINDKYYMQRKGTGIGVPGSSVTVDLVMEDLLDGIMDELGYDPLICVKYVDDLLFIIPKEEVENTLTILNGYNRCLKFTMEPEVSGRLPYLDVELLKQGDGKILTKWYCKPMASNRLLNFKSNHQLKQKLNVASNLMKRICELTTINPPRDNLPLITSILVKNHYPVSLINKLFYKYINGKETKETNMNLDVRNIKYRTFPNVCNLTDKIVRCTRKYDQNIQICPKNIKTIKNLHSRVKARVEIAKQTNCIYCVGCKDCMGEYWGMTKQRVGTRLGQHLGDIELLHRMREELNIEKLYDFKDEIDILLEKESESDKTKKGNGQEEPKNATKDGKTKRTRKKKSEETKLDKVKKLAKQYEKSGLVNHHATTGHRIDFQNARIVERESNRSKLEILEVLHIKTNENNINKKEDLAKIKNNYDGVLMKIKKKNERKRAQQNDKAGPREKKSSLQK